MNQVLDGAAQLSKIEPGAAAVGGQGSNALLHQIFERQATANPDRIALVCAGKQLTYAQAEGRANQIAWLLGSRGVRREDRVALLLPRSMDAIVAMLGILKAGAAYVPLEAQYPDERVEFILSDCGARALITDSTLAPKVGAFRGQTLNLDSIRHELDALPTHSPDSSEISMDSRDLCYVIYTSGSTGQPKGVEIEHRSVCHLVTEEARLFKLDAKDRVFQGFSIAFDASVEEIWLAFCAGATLVVGTSEMVHAGPDLPRWLTEAGITVLSCVPTLLAMMEGDVPALRLLILGGEACPPELVKRWWRPGRRIVNTYGPTEATVVSTWTDCHLSEPITIGRPLPGYSIRVLDESGRPAAPGAAGELCIGGIGLARGYLGRPELTREKFPELAFDHAPPQRIYRTGDLARLREDGAFDFLGRIDDQVKIRGFRVELGEIEAALMSCPQIGNAAVVLREDTPGQPQLVAYVVLRNPEFDLESVREQLRSKLPSYMVPAVFELLPRLPTLPSGKVDRRNLPPPRPSHAPCAGQAAPPRTALEARLVDACERLFAPAAVSIHADFFLDLGGHSLLASRLVSDLRRTAPFERISMLDLYRHPTIASLATQFETAATAEAGATSEPSRSLNDSAARMSTEQVVSSDAKAVRRHFLCGAAQAVSLIFVLTFIAFQWLAPYLTYTILVDEEFPRLEAVLWALASLVLVYPVMLVVPIIAKWLIIGRYKPGIYPLWGQYYFRFWLVNAIEGAVPVRYLTGTPLLNIYLRLMGARVGPNAFLASDSFAIYDTLELGANASINTDASLLGFHVEQQSFRIGNIRVGQGCCIGVRCILGPDTAMQEGSSLEDLSSLPPGAIVPRAEIWTGSPAAKCDENYGPPVSGSKELPSAPVPALRRRAGFALLHGLGLLVFPALVVAALFPGIVMMNQLNYLDPYYWYLLLSPIAGLSFVVFLCLEIACLKWILLGRVKPGALPLHSFRYFKKWFVDQTLNLSLDLLGSLYASVYLAPWYKLLGAKLGRGVEISTASFISPDLMDIGDESFVADDVSLGAPRARNGEMELGINKIGKRSFIGNSALLPPNAVVGNSVLIGCLSTIPGGDQATRADTNWLGSPAIFLPERQKSAPFPEETTYTPSTWLRIERAMIEFVRVIAPSTCFIILTCLLFSVLLLLRDHLTLSGALLCFPALYIGCGLSAVALTIAAKWLLVWRYRPGDRPLWSNFVWRNELLNTLHEHLAGPFLVAALTGTPFVCWYFRLLGARIGRRVYMDTTDLSEFDLAHIEDEAVLNDSCTVQTHLFEDRVMKMSTVSIGPRCTVGAHSLVLYDTRMEDGAYLAPMSLLMKGEVLPAATRWGGIPTRPLPSKPG